MKSNSQKYYEFYEIINNSGFGTQFLIYLEKRATNPNAVWDDMTDESIQAEFIAKCQWIQHYANTKLGASDITIEVAASIINSEKATSFSKKISDKLFDGFMHFVVANEVNPQVLKSLMNTWLAEGRSLTELDDNKITPAQTAIYTKNIASFAALASMGVDITAIDGDGLSPLHVIVNKIENGSADISLLKAWIDAKLPTDMLSGKNSGKWAGKTAVEFAEIKGLVKATEILGGDVELANANLNELWNIKKDLIKQSYDMKMDSNPLIKEVIIKDQNKLLLHYLVDNYEEISAEVFAKFLSDGTLGLKSNILFSGKTALQKCIEQGYNDWALELAKSGVGTTTLDNGINILNYCVLYNNVDLLDMLSNEIDFSELAVPQRQHEISETSALPLTPLLQAVVEGKTEMVVKLAKAGVGTITLDNTNHVLNYVGIFGGSKKIEIAKALANAKIDVSNEKAQQALVGALYPKIDAEFTSVLINELGVPAKGALELFSTNNLLTQVECIMKLTTETNNVFLSKETKSFTEDLKKSVIKKTMTSKEKTKFILKQVATNASLEDLMKNYPGVGTIDEQYINAFKKFKITQLENPKVFEKICKIFKVEIPKIEDKGIELLGSLSDSTENTVIKEINVEHTGEASSNE